MEKTIYRYANREIEINVRAGVVWTIAEMFEDVLTDAIHGDIDAQGRVWSLYEVLRENAELLYKAATD